MSRFYLYLFGCVVHSSAVQLAIDVGSFAFVWGGKYLIDEGLAVEFRLVPCSLTDYIVDGASLWVGQPNDFAYLLISRYGKCVHL